MELIPFDQMDAFEQEQARGNGPPCSCLAWAWTQIDGLPPGRTWVAFKNWTAEIACTTCAGDGFLPSASAFPAPADDDDAVPF